MNHKMCRSYSLRPRPLPHSSCRVEPDEDEPGGRDSTPDRDDVEALHAEVETLRQETRRLQEEVEHQKERFKDLWRANCLSRREYDRIVSDKDAEIERLHDQLLPGGNGTENPGSEGGHSYTGKDPEMRLDDWLPSLERAATWNEWMEEERLMQLAGHLRGRALQEWGLLSTDNKQSFDVAVASLRLRVDPGSRTLAAQDFRHTKQEEKESASTFIRRLERTFQVAYGHDRMLSETQNTLLHG